MVVSWHSVRRASFAQRRLAAIRVWWVCAAILATSGVLVAADMVPSYMG